MWQHKKSNHFTFFFINPTQKMEIDARFFHDSDAKE